MCFDNSRLILNYMAEQSYIVVIIQMSADKTMKLTDYLPPEHKEKVLNLVKRLHEQTQSKNQYMNMYRKTIQENQELKKKCNKLRDQNDYLKQQIHNSFSIVSQVRANFKANKQKQSASKPKEEQQWEDQSQQQQQNRPICANQPLSLVHHPPRPISKSPLQKYRPQMTSAQKDNKLLNLSNSYLNQTNLSSVKSKQLQEMKKQVRALQQQRKRDQQKDKGLEAKLKLVNQIKNRFKNDKDQVQVSSKQRPIQRIDITNTFENEEKVGPSNQKTTVAQPSKAIVSKNQPDKPIQQQKYQLKIKSSNTVKSNKKVVTPEDYGDVLQLINCYNL